MTACLELWREGWKQLLPADDHRHEVGEDRSRCMNCMLAETLAGFSPFETACIGWYGENVNGFTMEAGVVAGAFRALRLKGIGRRLFGEAMNLIHQSAIYIQRARAES